MRLEDDGETLAWLMALVSEMPEFDWDSGNRGKNLKHGVTDGEIESILLRDFAFVGRVTEPMHSERRGLILGTLEDGRLMALIFTRRGRKLRPISCRYARTAERRLYESHTKNQA